MLERKPLAARVALSCTGAATLHHPDRLHLVFDEPLLRSIAKALAALDAIDEIGARITLPLGDSDAFSCHGRPWTSKNSDDGRFVVSSLWVHVEAERLHVEVWETDSDDELHGFVEFAEAPALREAIGQHRHWSEEDLLQRLCVAPAEAMAHSVALPVLLRALRLAEPWLVKLGDHIGNGTPDDPMGRCTALLAVRRALARSPAVDPPAPADTALGPDAPAAH